MRSIDLGGAQPLIPYIYLTQSALLDLGILNNANRRLPAFEAKRTTANTEYHDTHPSHNITTGGGKAHGIGVQNDTMPTLLQHTKSFIELANNDADVMREQAVDTLARV